MAIGRLKMGAMECLALDYIDGLHYDKLVWPYVVYDVNITRLAKKLLKEGYAEYAPSSYVLQHSTIKDMGKFLQINNDSVKGKKGDYIDHILHHYSNGAITSYFKEKYYLVSGKGLPYKEMGNFLSEIYYTGADFSLYESFDIKQMHPNISVWEVALLQIDKENTRLDNFTTHLDVNEDVLKRLSVRDSDIRRSLNKKVRILFNWMQYEKAIEPLLGICISDLCGNISLDHDKLEYVIKKDSCVIRPDIINKLNECIKASNSTIESVHLTFFNVWHSIELNSPHYSVNEIWDIILNAMNSASMNISNSLVEPNHKTE